MWGMGGKIYGLQSRHITIPKNVYRLLYKVTATDKLPNKFG